MMKYIFITGGILAVFLLASCKQHKPLETVDYVDLKKYAGKWYEIASFPQRFQKGCHNTMAEYQLTDKDYIKVINRCNKGSIKGELNKVEGKAFVQKGSGNSKLKVQFFWPFRGKYWIIDLPDDYSYAVVGHPNREYLWILSRTPDMDEELYKEIISRVEKKGFDISKLEKTVHG